ncbi:MAG: hypothetical protein AAF348_13230, partial [Bacteroidota bacterium]
ASLLGSAWPRGADDLERRDLGVRAAGDAGALRPLDPSAYASRAISLALGRSLAGDHAGARDAAWRLYERAEELELGDVTLAESALAVLAVEAAAAADNALDRREFDRAVAAVQGSMDGPPFVDGGRRDAGWVVLAKSALVRSRLSLGEPAVGALAPLTDLIDDLTLGLDGPDRRRLVYPRLAAASRGLGGPLPVHAAAALAFDDAAAARELMVDGDDAGEAIGRAVDALVAVSRAGAGGLGNENNAFGAVAGDAIREAADLLRLRGGLGIGGRTDRERAAMLLLQVVEQEPAHPLARMSADIAATENAPADRAVVLSRLLGVIPAHPSSDRWKIELASIGRDTAALDLLERVERPGPLSLDADRLGLELVDELVATASDERRLVLLERAKRFADRLGSGAGAVRTAALAEAMIETDPARAIEMARVVRGSASLVPGGASRVEMIEARAHAAAGDDASAFSLLERVTRRLEGRREYSRLFWHASTLRLEIAFRAARDAGDNLALGAARAHLARLRLLDDGLGGEPWVERLNALAERP